jgi:hypothetical protein
VTATIVASPSLNRDALPTHLPKRSAHAEVSRFGVAAGAPAGAVRRDRAARGLPGDKGLEEPFLENYQAIFGWLTRTGPVSQKDVDGD